MPTMQPTGVESQVGDLARFYQALEDAGAQERATVLAAVEDRLQGFLFGAGGRLRRGPREPRAADRRRARFGACAVTLGAAAPTAGTCSGAKAPRARSRNGCRCLEASWRPKRSTSILRGACWRCRARSACIPGPEGPRHCRFAGLEPAAVGPGSEADAHPEHRGGGVGRQGCAAVAHHAGGACGQRQRRRAAAPGGAARLRLWDVRGPVHGHAGDRPGPVGGGPRLALR